MSDFSPEVRNSAIWATDAARIVRGHGLSVVLEKQGKKEMDDLSGIEAVQMGHVMQPILISLASKRLGEEVEPFDLPATHPTEPWVRSHTDGKASSALVECKNVGLSQRKYFDEDSRIVPPYYRAQCVHEALVFGTDMVWMSVLVGGQEHLMIPLEVSEQEKQEHLERIATFWGHIKADTTPDPVTLEECKLAYAISAPAMITATAEVERAAASLKQIKADIKKLEEAEEGLQSQICAWMRDNDTLSTYSGEILATWKSAKASKRFDSKLFQQSMPDLYQKFVIESPGSRRFLLK
jgi:predicted phage-related endonuclease